MHTHTHTHTFKYTCVATLMRACFNARTHARTHARTQARTHAHACLDTSKGTPSFMRIHDHNPHLMHDINAHARSNLGDSQLQGHCTKRNGQDTAG
jgi:hypothetical protein